jgi:hypothetical protein
MDPQTWAQSMLLPSVLLAMLLAVAKRDTC